MVNKMRIGLVILNYNDKKTVIDYVNNICSYNSIDKIVIVDNASTDGSYEELCKIRNNKIDVIKTDSNGGYASGNNVGVRYLINNYSSEYIIVSNPDVCFTENIITEMIACLEERADAGIVACRMNCLSAIHLPVAWKLPTYIDCLFQDSFIIKRLIGDRTEYKYLDLWGDVCKVDVLPGSLFAIRSSVFNEVGGFDESTFLYYEENILAFKLKAIGKINYLINKLEYNHYHSVSINKSIASVKKRLDLSFESRELYCRKYLRCNEVQISLMKVFHFWGTSNYLAYNGIKEWLKNIVS